MFMEQRLATLEEEFARLRDSLSPERLAEIENRCQESLAARAGIDEQAQSSEQRMLALEHQQAELRTLAEELAARIDRSSDGISNDRLSALEVRIAGVDGARADLVERFGEEQRLRAGLEERLQALERLAHEAAEHVKQVSGSEEHLRGRLEQVETGLAGLPLNDLFQRLDGTEQTVGGYHGWLTNIAAAQDQLRDRADRVEAVLANWQSQNLFARIEQAEHEITGWKSLNVPQTLQATVNELGALRNTTQALARQVDELRSQKLVQFVGQLKDRLDKLEQRCVELENRPQEYEGAPRRWAWLGPALGLSAFVIAVMALYRTPRFPETRSLAEKGWSLRTEARFSPRWAS